MTKTVLTSLNFKKFVEHLDNSLGHSDNESYQIILFNNFIEVANRFAIDISGYDESYVFFRMVSEFRSYLEELSEIELKLAEVYLSKRMITLVLSNQNRAAYGAIKLNDLNVLIFGEPIGLKNMMIGS